MDQSENRVKMQGRKRVLSPKKLMNIVAPDTLQAVVFRPQFICTWDISQSYGFGPQASLGFSQLDLTTSVPLIFPLSLLSYVSRCLPLQKISNPFLFTLFHFLQSLISGMIIIFLSLHTYSHVCQNPKRSSQLQKVPLEFVPDAKQQSAANSPKLFDSVQFHPQFGYPFSAFPLAGLLVLGPTWPKHNSISELIPSPSCLTLAIRANPTVIDLGRIGTSLCQALVTWAIPGLGAQAPTNIKQQQGNNVIRWIFHPHLKPQNLFCFFS